MNLKVENRENKRKRERWKECGNVDSDGLIRYFKLISTVLFLPNRLKSIDLSITSNGMKMLASLANNWNENVL